MRVQYTGRGSLDAVVTGGYGPRKFAPLQAGGFLSEEMSEDEALWWSEVPGFTLVSEPLPKEKSEGGKSITMDVPPEDQF